MYYGNTSPHLSCMRELSTLVGEERMHYDRNQLYDRFIYFLNATKFFISKLFM
jgi:hypothetical protein